MPSLFPEPSQPRVPATRPNPQTPVLAHCDGGARGNPGPAGYGAVLQTETGEILAELSEFLGIRTNNFAEYSGLLGVLEWTLANGYKRLRVVSDSELMVKQIQGRYKVNSPDLKPLWTEARRRIALLDEFEISHALRHKNKTADRLANEAMDAGMGRAGRPAPSTPASTPPLAARATPYPQREGAPLEPASLRGPASRPIALSTPKPATAAAVPSSGTMHRGFVRDGVVHPLGGVTLPEGTFVKIVVE